MSKLPAFEDLLAEFQADGIGPLNLELLSGVVDATAKGKSYLPASLIELGIDRWDKEGRETLLNSWIADRLLGKRDLRRVYERFAKDPEADTDHLRANLFTSLKQHMSNLRGLQEERNLWRRLKAICDDNETLALTGTGSATSVHLASGPDGESPIDIWGLRAVANQFTAEDLNLRQVHSGNRATSPITDAALQTILKAMLAEASGSIRLTDVHKAISLRLALPIEGFSPEEDAHDLESADPATDEAAIEAVEAEAIAEAAAATLAELTRDEVEALAAYSEEESFAKAGKRIGASENTARNRCGSAINRLADALNDRDLMPTVAISCQKDSFGATMLVRGLEALTEMISKQRRTK